MFKSEYRYRLYVGPYHSHYDWSGINLGASFTPATSTCSGQSSGATTLNVGSGSSFPTLGGVWVGPNDTGQDWEYERVTAKSGNTLTVVRESASDRDHDGSHANGAVVTTFYQVTTFDGQLQITDESDERLAAISWRATVSGVRCPYRILRNGHIAVLTESVDGGAFTVALVGFIESPNVDDDWQTRGDWTMTIVSSPQLLADQDAPGVRVGDTDLADAGSASGATELVLVYDERASGDYAAADPDLSPQSAIDNDLSSLWLTERFVGTDIWSGSANGDEENDGALAFAHIYVNPPPSAGSGARFIELRTRSSVNVAGYALNSANGGSGVEVWIFGGPGSVAAGASIYLVEDEEVFTRLNPLAQQGTIYENRAFFTHIQADGGELWLRIGELNQWLSRVRWGDGNGLINHEDAPDNDWDGPYVTAPSVGQTMRYIWTASGANPADYWETSMVRHAGYNIDDDDNFTWIMVTLPGFGLTLAQDITSSSPGSGGFLYIYGPDEKYSTDGLSSSGTIVIGDEEITYSSKTTSYVVVSARGANGTTAAIHNAEDAIYVKDGSVYTDAYLIGSIGWQGSRSGIYPKNFTLYRTNIIENVRNPEQEDYLTDWDAVVAITNNSASYHTASGINARVRHLLYEIHSMTEDPARVRIAEINAIVNPSTHNPDQFMATNTTAGALIAQLCGLAGIWPGAVSHSGTPQIGSTTTATDNAWAVCVDIAEFAGCRITVARDSKLVVAPSTFWTAPPSPTTAWTRANAENAKKIFRKGSPVSQVILPWRAPSGEDSGKIFFPAVPGYGSKLEEPETLYSSASAATAAAQRLYYYNLYPFEVSIKAAITAYTKRAGEAHSLTWAFDPARPAFSRNYVVLSAEHQCNGGHWTSTFRLMQYGHESNM